MKLSILFFQIGIEAASLGMAAIGTKGRIFVRGADHSIMMTFLNKIRELGGGFSVKRDGIEFFYDGPLQGSLHLGNRCSSWLYDRLATTLYRSFNTIYRGICCS